MKEKLQKKKTPLIIFFDYLFKVLVVITIFIFAFIIYDKFEFKGNEINYTSNNNYKKKAEKPIPSKLKWNDPFKGIENLPSKKQKENKKTNNLRMQNFKISK